MKQSETSLLSRNDESETRAYQEKNCPHREAVPQKPCGGESQSVPVSRFPEAAVFFSLLVSDSAFVSECTVLVSVLLSNYSVDEF